MTALEPSPRAGSPATQGADGAAWSLSPAAALAEADAVTTAMARLTVLAAGAGGWSAADRRSLLARLDLAVDGLGAVRATVLVAERDAGTWQDAGDRSFEAWRGRTARTGERSAAAQVRQAGQLTSVPAAVAAVAEGRISLDHATTMAKVASSGTPAQQAAAQDPTVQAELLEAAELVDAGTFATTVARWAAGIDPESLEADHQVQRRERFLHVTPTPRGTFVKGQLDSMAGHRLTLALEALSPRPAADDDRDPGQRRADALDAIAGRILSLADTKPGGHVPPQISMILTAETWTAARALRDLDRDRDHERRRRRRRHDHGTQPSVDLSEPDCAAPAGPTHRAGSAVPTRSGRPGDPGDAAVAGVRSSDDASTTGYPLATLEDGMPVPPSELARAMCDCAVSRIVLDADSVPVNLGRTQRLFTGEQRRAVIARDRECVWPDCHANARWAEIHHVLWWERDDGSTDVANAVLLCSFHHHETHRRDLTITRVASAARDGSPPGRPPEGSRGPGDLTAFRYEFCDRSGRLVGDPSPPDRGCSRNGTDDGHDVTWTTDPVTGMRVPDFSWTGEGRERSAHRCLRAFLHRAAGPPSCVPPFGTPR